MPTYSSRLLHRIHASKIDAIKNTILFDMAMVQYFWCPFKKYFWCGGGIPNMKHESLRPKNIEFTSVKWLLKDFKMSSLHRFVEVVFFFRKKKSRLFEMKSCSFLGPF